MGPAVGNHEIDPGFLGSILRYDPDTGKLFWLPREASLFQDGEHTAEHSCAKWNARYAGAEAFTTKGNGYLRGKIGGRAMLAHRVIWALETGSWPLNEIDHINGSRADNRWENLREATGAQNRCNRHCVDGLSSQYRGVSWAQREQKWVVKIQAEGKAKHVGYFACEVEAARAYDTAARREHGAFASLNFREAA